MRSYVCLSSRGPNSAALLRYGSRLAGRLNRNWYAVYVQTPREEPTTIDATTQRYLVETLTLANLLGAIVFTYKGEDIVDTILHFAREYRVGHIVIGRPGPQPLWKRLMGRKTLVERLILKASGLTVVIVDAKAQPRAEDRSSAWTASLPARRPSAGGSAPWAGTPNLTSTLVTPASLPTIPTILTRTLETLQHERHLSLSASMEFCSLKPRTSSYLTCPCLKELRFGPAILGLDIPHNKHINDH